MKSSGATGTSILTGLMSFAVQAEPLLNLLMMVISIISGCFAISWWISRFRDAARAAEVAKDAAAHAAAKASEAATAARIAANAAAVSDTAATAAARPAKPE